MPQRDFISFQVWPSSNNVAFYKVQSFMYFWSWSWENMNAGHVFYSCLYRIGALQTRLQCPRAARCPLRWLTFLGTCHHESSHRQTPARQQRGKLIKLSLLHISQNMNWSISMLLKIDLCSAKVQRKSHFCRTFRLQLWLDCSRLVLDSIITFLLLLQRSQLPSQDWRGGAGTLAARL